METLKEYTEKLSEELPLALMRERIKKLEEQIEILTAKVENLNTRLLDYEQ
jgi:ubiquinone biosynthesis protein UbiJ